MGFGSYDESEQEQPDENDEEDTGEDWTGTLKPENSNAEGEDEMADLTTEEMMEHL